MAPSHSTIGAPPPTGTARPERMNPWNWVLLVFGALLTLLGLIMSVIGLTALSADAAQRDGQYVTFATDGVETVGYALLSSSLEIDPAESESLKVPPGDLVSLRMQATSLVPDQEIFVGIGPAAEVSTYLDDVPHSSLDDASWQSTSQMKDGLSWFDSSRANVTIGSSEPVDPTTQTFWAESASGAGAQEITWDVEPGQWSLVIMNADTSRPVWVDVQAGVRSDLAEPFIGSAGTGLLLTGLAVVVLGVGLQLLGAGGLGRNIDPRRQDGYREMATTPSVFPARLIGYLDQPVSRWLWLVKWLLAIPHYIVLSLLGFALLFTTIASGIAILIIGRYPRPWFLFSVGVLRWSWRVGFYSYSALATDRYPPFTLAYAEYPADFTVSYPERLSRGLVLVKWWLLIFPHLLIVGIFTGGMGAAWMMTTDQNMLWGTTGRAPSLLGLLVLFVAVILLFTARYRLGLFALIMGINRWVFRVLAYGLLLRDDYPPFRLDQGPVEPSAEHPKHARRSKAEPGDDPGPAADTPERPL